MKEINPPSSGLSLGSPGGANNPQRLIRQRNPHDDFAQAD